GVGIVAGRRVGGVHAPRLGPAGVVGADVAVVAAPWRSHTPPAGAGVAGGARVEVVTRGGVRRVHAPGQRARVIRADVAVVTVPPRADTAAAYTRVSRRAGVVIVARPGPGRIHAARCRITGVRRA